jgi:hypothetical protein
MQSVAVHYERPRFLSAAQIKIFVDGVVKSIKDPMQTITGLPVGWWSEESSA